MVEQIDIIRKLINRKILFHSIFWISIINIVFIYENWDQHQNFNIPYFAQYILAFCVFIAVSYFNLYVLVPRLFKTKKYGYFVVSLIISMFAAAGLIVLLRIVFNLFFDLNLEALHDHKHFGFFYFLHVLFGQCMFLLATTFFYILEEWIRFQDVTIKMKAIESEKIQSELQALKAQINPHFLFNTLNNIYSHSLDNSPKTPKMILRLSELMSYILYECHDEKVPLSNELHFIKNYLELEKLRFEDQIIVETVIETPNPEHRIVPLLLIPFLENAFKHGGTSFRSKMYVKVKIYSDDQLISFEVANSINSENKGVSAKVGGLGIENVQKRLELLYPEKHKLSIIKTENEFKVELKLENHGN
jgi:two-component system LytT family sensor kinase